MSWHHVSVTEYIVLSIVIGDTWRYILLYVHTASFEDLLPVYV